MNSQQAVYLTKAEAETIVHGLNRLLSDDSRVSTADLNDRFYHLVDLWPTEADHSRAIAWLKATGSLVDALKNKNA